MAHTDGSRRPLPLTVWSNVAHATGVGRGAFHALEVGHWPRSGAEVAVGHAAAPRRQAFIGASAEADGRTSFRH